MQHQAQINFGGDYHEVVLSDVAGYEDRFSLDVDGFEFVSGVYGYARETLSEEAYDEWISSWLKSHLNCSEVFVFDRVTRHENYRTLGKKYSDVARRVHCG